MGVGSFTLACVLLAVGAGGPGDEVHLNQTQFKIPITIQPGRQADIRDLVLYCSRDEGTTWQAAGLAKPNQDGFLYTANALPNLPVDGKYWFRVAFVNQKGVQEPSDIFNAPTYQKVVIDTIKPDIHVLAERLGEEIAVGWDILEQNPRHDSLKLDFRPADAPEGVWNAVAVPAGQNRVAFRPNTSATVVVRVQMEDLAGNLGSGQATVQGAAAAPAIVQTTLPSPPPPAPPPIVFVAPPPSSGNAGLNGNPVPPNYPPALVRQGEGAPGLGQQGPATTLQPTPMRGLLPALQIVNKSQVRLEYAVAKLGPSGVGSVEVYVTTDEGQTWERCPAEMAAGLPINDMRPGATVTGGVLVPLPKDEVVYGFCMVVKSRAGLGKPPPKSGDVPQIRIERDTAPPLAHWLRPLPDPTRRDSLILAWEASDRNLAQNPVTLEWAKDPGGPWQLIGKPDLPNTGRYTWQVPYDIPPSVYLRLTVRDSAGNVGVHQTEQPELVDLSVPEATITGVGGMR